MPHTLPLLLLFSVTRASWTSAPTAEKGDELRDGIVESLEKWRFFTEFRTLPSPLCWSWWRALKWFCANIFRQKVSWWWDGQAGILFQENITDIAFIVNIIQDKLMLLREPLKTSHFQPKPKLPVLFWTAKNQVARWQKLNKVNGSFQLLANWAHWRKAEAGWQAARQPRSTRVTKRVTTNQPTKVKFGPLKWHHWRKAGWQPTRQPRSMAVLTKWASSQPVDQ